MNAEGLRDFHWTTYACRTCTVLEAEQRMCRNVKSFGAGEMWIFGWYETSGPRASRANGALADEKSNSSQQNPSQA